MKLRLITAGMALQHQGAVLLQLLYGVGYVALHNGTPDLLAHLQGGGQWVTLTLTAAHREAWG